MVVTGGRVIIIMIRNAGAAYAGNASFYGMARDAVKGRGFAPKAPPASTVL